MKKEGQLKEKGNIYPIDLYIYTTSFVSCLLIYNLLIYSIYILSCLLIVVLGINWRGIGLLTTP